MRYTTYGARTHIASLQKRNSQKVDCFTVDPLRTTDGSALSTRLSYPLGNHLGLFLRKVGLRLQACDESIHIGLRGQGRPIACFIEGTSYLLISYRDTRTCRALDPLRIHSHGRFLGS